MVNIKSTSNAIWWIKNPHAVKVGDRSGRKKSFGSSFCLDLADLLRNISLQGYNKLLATELTLVERLIWLLVHTATFIGMLAVLLFTWEQFIGQYFVINLKDPIYPVENVPFPAVSICPNNRISRQAVTSYALELQSNDPSPRQLDYYLEKLGYLKKLFVAAGDGGSNSEDYHQFQSFLDIFGSWNNETFFNTRRIMTMLAPSCRSYILKCSLANADIPCFSEDAFEDNLTRYGSCCTFNNNDKYLKRDVKNNFAFATRGLNVVINASRDDDFAPILRTNGYIVMIHDPDNFPSISSSNMLELNPGQGEVSLLSLSARVIDTDKSLHGFSPTRRRCYFAHEANISINELRSEKHSTYSLANCITRCRIRSIIALCNCLPFQVPLELVESLEGVVFCTLNHVSCLSQYHYKWNNVLTERVRIPGLERENEEALFCPQCLPACYDVQFRMSMSALPIDNYLSTLKYDNNETQLNATNISVLKVFFGLPRAQLYMRLLNNEWFEIFSTVGNILSIFMGFSIVVIFELLYFTCKYIYVGCSRIIDNGRVHNGVKKLDAKNLYICP